jgi:hypothetical protein
LQLFQPVGVYINWHLWQMPVCADTTVVRIRRLLLSVKQRALAITALVAVLVCALASSAFADAGVILNESLDTSVARITGSGHSAVYLSNICPDGSPVKMRLCHSGEEGSVISNYTTLGEDQPYEWNIVPLSVYLYGVENSSDRPLIGSREIKTALEERYREKYLAGICTNARCRYSNGAEWREMVGATLERSMYMFVVNTSVEQDRALIAEFNSQPNVNHFHGLTRNCADFTRRVMNFYFPKSVNPDYMNDFFITTPKAVAHSLTKYAEDNPELDFRVLHFAQIPGTIKRSSECRNGTEQLYHSKKLLLPLAVFAWQGVPAVAASYIISGRFNPEHQFEAHPSTQALEADDNLTASPAIGYTISVQQLAAEEKLKGDEIVGTKDDWKRYRDDLDTAVEEAIRAEIIPDHNYLKRVFKILGEGSSISVDARGALWMTLAEQEMPVRVGLSASNILAPDSDIQFAYQIALARMNSELDSPKHSRETAVEFRQDWARVQNSRIRRQLFAAAQASAQASTMGHPATVAADAAGESLPIATPTAHAVAVSSGNLGNLHVPNQLPF